MSHPSRQPRQVPRRRRDGARGAFIPVLWLLGLMWVLEVLDLLLPVDLDQYGIRARDADGLSGIAFSPLLHHGFGHLLANSLPFLLLGALVAAGGRRRFWEATGTIVVIGGLGTWLISPENSVTVGVSGVIFGYLTYLLARAFFARRAVDVIVAVVVLFLYGTLLLGALPGVPGVSWQAHLMGAAAGILGAWRLASDRPWDRH
jgi:membrane associated rhomboid family serine protease